MGAQQRADRCAGQCELHRFLLRRACVRHLRRLVRAARGDDVGAGDLLRGVALQRHGRQLDGVPRAAHRGRLRRRRRKRDHRALPVGVRGAPLPGHLHRRAGGLLLVRLRGGGAAGLLHRAGASAGLAHRHLHHGDAGGAAAVVAPRAARIAALAGKPGAAGRGRDDRGRDGIRHRATRPCAASTQTPRTWPRRRPATAAAAC